MNFDLLLKLLSLENPLNKVFLSSKFDNPPMIAGPRKVGSFEKFEETNSWLIQTGTTALTNKQLIGQIQSAVDKSRNPNSFLIPLSESFPYSRLKIGNFHHWKEVVSVESVGNKTFLYLAASFNAEETVQKIDIYKNKKKLKEKLESL